MAPRMGAVWTGLTTLSWGFTEKRQSVLTPGRHLKDACANRPPAACSTPRGGRRAQVATQCNAKEGAVWDLFYIGLTIVIFAALWLLVKGVERFER